TSSHVRGAVHVDRRAGEVAGTPGGQEADEVRELRRRHHLAHGEPREHGLLAPEHRRRALRELGVDDPGRDHVGEHATRPVVAGPPPGERPPPPPPPRKPPHTPPPPPP